MFIKINFVRKYRPQSDHTERSDLAKRFCRVGEGESREPRDREREGQGLKYPQ
jgi:hypothetical protein